MTKVEKGQTLHCYWNLSSCKACSLKAQCTPAKERRVTRWEYEAVVEAMQARLDRKPDAMRTFGGAEPAKGGKGMLRTRP